ncbi:hypothetical protein AMATHDRAFT_41813 [Amanita thiersii Skay4041]|uniref:Transmembrane protein n=1 Tax=Amanita thiersii Skay4041 TaxID=703135 RepID=A0A2A9NMU6_9AGAR|nr:hypothetical protein AMATHDRAFT_41813 [Amanita thiersii Skay4041]
MVTVVYNHSDPSVRYDDNWSLLDGIVNNQFTLYGLSYHSPTSPNATCRFSFEGTRVSVVGYISAPPEHQWHVNYIVDGSLLDTRTYRHLNSSIGDGFQLFYQSASLEPGAHRLEIQLVSGPTNVIGEINIGYFVVVPINVRVGIEGTNSSSITHKDLEYVDDDDSRISYSTAWQDGRQSPSVSAELSSETLHFPSSQGEVSITFNGIMTILLRLWKQVITILTGTSIAAFASYFLNYNFDLKFHLNGVLVTMPNPWGGELRTFPEVTDVVNEWPIYSSDQLPMGVHNLAISFDGQVPSGKFGIDAFIIQSPGMTIPASTGTESTLPTSLSSSKPPGSHHALSNSAFLGVIVACVAFGIIVGGLYFIWWQRRLETESRPASPHVNSLVINSSGNGQIHNQGSELETNTSTILTPVGIPETNINSVGSATRTSRRTSANNS